MQQSERKAWDAAFRWLAGIEVGELSDYSPESDESLLVRVQTLASLFNVLPRRELNRLPELVCHWDHTFSGLTSVSLSELRRESQSLFSREEVPSQDDAWSRALQFCGLPLQAKSRHEATGFSDKERQICADGLHRWYQEIESNPSWNSLPGIVPGEADRPLSEVFVELSAVEEEEVILSRERAIPRRRNEHRADDQFAHVSVESMISRVVERCVVVGDPGSGKSTLVKWLAWAVNRGRFRDFDLAVAVKLSAYAASVDNESQSPVEFFFRTMQLDAPLAREAARVLRGIASDSRRCLLLLDGWDEIPYSRRNAIRECIAQEAGAYITLVTSRPSGMPRQLVENRRASCFRIVGLTPEAAFELAQRELRRMGHGGRVDAIWNRIQNDPQLQSISTSPFLLSLLVRSLAESGYDQLATRAAIYRQVIAWIRRHYDALNEGQPALIARHLDGLASLSLSLLNNPLGPRYLFGRRELEGIIGDLNIDPILRSRFVTQPNAVFDEFAFLHATLQEYLAAEFASTLPADELRTLLQRFFYSSSRFIVLDFLAGLGGSASRLCQELCGGLWGQRDRFQHMAVRFARLATAGRWPLDDLGRSVRAALWELINDEDQLELCDEVVRSFANWDSAELIQRVTNKPPHSWAINCLLGAVPPQIARQHNIEQLLDGEWRDVARFDALGGATEAEREELRHRLGQRELSAADLRESILQIGGSRDYQAIPELLSIAKDSAQHVVVREEAVTSIGRIGGSEAVRSIRDLLLSGSAISDAIARMSAVSFVHPAIAGTRLDPESRDAILRRLAAIPPTNPRVDDYLTALETFPIREGAEIIVELAKNGDVSLGVRRQAIIVLISVTDRRLLKKLLNGIDSEPADLSGDWLFLAMERGLPVPIAWLRHRVSQERNHIQRHKLIVALCKLLSTADDDTRIESIEFMDLLIARAFDGEDSSELALALSGAINQISASDSILFSNRSRNLALQSVPLVARLERGVDQSRLLLAVSLVRHFRDVAACRHLADLLQRASESSLLTDDTAVAIANCLADLTPEILLQLPSEAPGVVSVLRTRSAKHGWVVNSDRILDAEGDLIASFEGKTPTSRLGHPTGFQTLLDELSPQMRRALESYWFMVRRGGPSHPQDSLSQIHEAAFQRHEEDDSDLGEALRSLFPKKFPKFDTWSRQLNRVQAVFENREDAVTWLRTLGLYRRS